MLLKAIKQDEHLVNEYLRILPWHGVHVLDRVPVQEPTGADIHKPTKTTPVRKLRMMDQDT